VNIPCSEFSQTNFTVLQNSSKVAPYIDEHMNIILSENPQKNLAWITRQHIKTFDYWFRRKLLGKNQLIKNFNGLLGDHQSPSSNTKGTKSMGIHFTREIKTKKAPTKTVVSVCV